ncbi:hypothetical protein GX586_14450 [bacterium]|nr:hypothetical protein [bacterium]
MMAVLAVLTAVFAAVSALQWQAVRIARRDGAADSEALRAALVREAALSNELAAVRRAGGPAAVPSETQEAINYLSGRAALVAAPELADTLRHEFRGSHVRSAYGGFLDALLLDASEREEIERLIVERMLARALPRTTLARVGVPPAEREAAIAKIKADQAGIDARISALLNRDDRERYAAFVAMERFRLIASWFNFDLLLKGKQTLSTVQAERLASALSAADAWARAQPGFVDFEFIAPEEITDTAVDTFTRQERAADSRALGEARAFLTGEQTAALSAYMASIQESNEARLRLTARVLHPDAAPAAADAEE